MLIMESLVLFKGKDNNSQREKLYICPIRSYLLPHGKSLYVAEKRYRHYEKTKQFSLPAIVASCQLALWSCGRTAQLDV